MLCLDHAERKAVDRTDMTKDELLEKVKAHLRLSIAKTLKIERKHSWPLLAVQYDVNSVLTMVIAIGHNTSLEGAVNDLRYFYGRNTRSELEVEIELCYKTFRREVSAFTRMLEMNQINVVPDDIWSFIKSSCELEDEDPEPESQIQDSWPRKVLIQPTAEKAIEMLGDRYDSCRDPEGDDSLSCQIRNEMRTYAELICWEHFKRNYDGYELVDPKLQQEFTTYIEKRFLKN